MIAYHVTTMDAAKQILKTGLIPNIGPNSRVCHEETPRIYLCDKKDIPFWNILLDKNVILKIEFDHNELENYEEVSYKDYGEYMSTSSIPADKIKLSRIKIDKEDAMKKLCIDTLYAISDVTRKVADYYNRPQWAHLTHDDIMQHLDVTICILERLDYSSLTKQHIKKELKLMGEELCMNTFVDYYFNTNLRLYQQLTQYPKDDLTEKLSTLRKLIENKLKGCLTVNTGGYCF